MKVMSVIKKYVAPQFEMQGYNLRYIDSVCCNFENKQGTADTTFTKVKRCPELLNEYLKYLEVKGPKLPPPALKVSYGVKATYKAGTQSVSPIAFNLGAPLDTAFFIYDKESFITGLNKLTRQSLDVVCPYLDLVASQIVLWEEAPYHLLKDQPEKLAKDFSEKYGIPILTEITDGNAVRQNIENAFYKVLPENHNERRDKFIKNHKDIAGLAAFCGEQILKYHSGRWGGLGTLPDRKDVFLFGLKFKDFNFCEKEDILESIVNSWNYSPQISGRGIFRRDFQEIFN